jgi:hypothetical protein
VGSGTAVAVSVGNGVGGTLEDVAVKAGGRVCVGGWVRMNTEVSLGRAAIGVPVGKITSWVGRLQLKKTMPSRVRRIKDFRFKGIRSSPQFYGTRLTFYRLFWKV